LTRTIEGDSIQTKEEYKAIKKLRRDFLISEIEDRNLRFQRKAELMGREAGEILQEMRQLEQLT